MRGWRQAVGGMLFSPCQEGEQAEWEPYVLLQWSSERGWAELCPRARPFRAVVLKVWIMAPLSLMGGLNNLVTGVT